MKQSFFLFLVAVIVGAGESLAQVTYESPYVKNGKTMRFTIPKGYNEMEKSDGSDLCQFVSQAEVGDHTESLLASAITISYTPIGLGTLEYLKKEMREEMSQDKSVTVMRNPIIENVNGHEFLLASYMGGSNFEVQIDRLYFGITRFGDYFVSVYYFATKGIDNILEYKDFKDCLATFEELETTKENAMSVQNEHLAYDDEVNYKNDLFETTLYYLDILPDYGEEWDEPLDENSHLLSEFTYKEENGSIKVFSGGQTATYPSEEEMANAIEQAMDWKKPMTLEFNSKFSNEDHVFRLYTISGGGTMSSVYTTEVNNELVFFVVDGGANPVDDFKPAVREFMLTMWIDYFDGEEEETEE